MAIKDSHLAGALCVTLVVKEKNKKAPGFMRSVESEWNGDRVTEQMLMTENMGILVSEL